MKLEELFDYMHRSMIGVPKSNIADYYRRYYNRILFDGNYEAALYLIENYNIPIRLQFRTVCHYLTRGLGWNHNIDSRVTGLALKHTMSNCINRLDKIYYLGVIASYMIRFNASTARIYIDGAAFTTFDLHFDQVMNHWMVNSSNVYMVILAIMNRCYREIGYDMILQFATGKYRTYIIYWLIASSTSQYSLTDRLLSAMGHQDILDFQRNQTYVDVFVKFCSSRGNQKHVDKFMKKLLALGLNVHIKCSDGRRLIDCCKQRLHKLLAMFA